jgi:hypothetical protein
VNVQLEISCAATLSSADAAKAQDCNAVGGVEGGKLGIGTV